MGESNPSSRFQVPGRPLNLTDRFLDENLRAGRGDRVALIEDAPHGIRRFTYREVVARTNRWGHLLRDRGVRMEERVALVLPDGVDWVAAFFGAQKIGATTFFLNPKISAEELAFYLEDSRARVLVCTAEVAADLPDRTPHLLHAEVVNDGGHEARLNRFSAELEPAPTLEEDFAIWLYSSGSTGAPKAAVHRAADFVFNTERYAKHVLQMSESDVTVSVPKLFFGYATGTNLLFPFYFGATTVLFPDKPTPARMFELIERHHPTLVVNVPTLIAQMLTHWESTDPRPALDGVRAFTSAGEALPAELWKRWQDGPGVQILDGIGSAEMFHVFISNRMGEVVPGSLGRLVEGYGARIVGPEGQDCAPGEVGTLWVEGDSAAAFYWNRAERSRDVLRGRWVVTGDLFVRTENGHFHYQGRADDMMKVSGRWVSPGEVEDCLTAHSAVLEAGVAPFEVEGLTKPMAFVTLREPGEEPPGLEAELRQWVADRLSPLKAPRRVAVVAELPRGDRDKLDRRRLARMAAESGVTDR